MAQGLPCGRIQLFSPRSNLNRPIHLAQFIPSEGEGRFKLLCTVQAPRAYVAATANIRQLDQLFLCYGGPRKGSLQAVIVPLGCGCYHPCI